MNECVTDKLQLIADSITALQCICSGLSASYGTNRVLSDNSVITVLAGNTDVDFTGDPIIEPAIGDEPSYYDPDRCIAVQALYDSMFDLAQGIVSYGILGLGLTAPAMVGLVLAVLTVPVPVSIIATLLLSLATFIWEPELQSQLDNWATYRDTIVCEWYRAGSIAEMRDIVIDNAVAFGGALIAPLLGVIHVGALMGLYLENSTYLTSEDGGHCWDCQSREFDYSWSGSPCGTADLMGTCVSDVITMYVANPVQSPGMTVPVPVGQNNLIVDIWVQENVPGNMDVILYRTSSPPGQLDLKTLAIAEGDNKVKRTIFYNVPACECYIKLQANGGVSAGIPAMSVKINDV